MNGQGAGRPRGWQLQKSKPCDGLVEPVVRRLAWVGAHELHLAEPRWHHDVVERLQHRRGHSVEPWFVRIRHAHSVRRCPPRGLTHQPHGKSTCQPLTQLLLGPGVGATVGAEVLGPVLGFVLGKLLLHDIESKKTKRPQKLRSLR